MINKTFSCVTKFSKTGEHAINYVEAIKDYAQHELKDRNISATQFSGILDIPKAEKAKKFNELYKALVLERSGVTLESYSNDIPEFTSNPSVVAYSQFLKKIAVEAIKPIVINAMGLSMIADIQYLEYGGVAEFELKDMKPFDVSEIADRQKHTDAQERLKTSKTVHMKQYGLTTITNLPEIWRGDAMVAEDIFLMALSISQKIYKLALTEFLAKAGDTVVKSSNVLGAYTEKTALKLANKIHVTNGAIPAFVGNTIGLKDLLPETANLRVLMSDGYITQGYMDKFSIYPVMAFDSVYDKNSEGSVLGLPDNRLYVMSTDSKPIKIAIGKVLTNADGDWDNNDLSKRTTMRQEIGVGTATCDEIGVIKLS